MEGFTDWNKLTTEEYIKHLENEFKFSSSSTAKAVFKLIAAYRALNISDVVVAKRKVCSKCGSTMVADMTEGDWCQSCGWVD